MRRYDQEYPDFWDDGYAPPRWMSRLFWLGLGMSVGAVLALKWGWLP